MTIIASAMVHFQLVMEARRYIENESTPLTPYELGNSGIPGTNSLDGRTAGDKVSLRQKNGGLCFGVFGNSYEIGAGVLVDPPKLRRRSL